MAISQRLRRIISSVEKCQVTRPTTCTIPTPHSLRRLSGIPASGLITPWALPFLVSYLTVQFPFPAFSFTAPPFWGVRITRPCFEGALSTLFSPLFFAHFLSLFGESSYASSPAGFPFRWSPTCGLTCSRASRRAQPGSSSAPVKRTGTSEKRPWSDFRQMCCIRYTPPPCLRFPSWLATHPCPLLTPGDLALNARLICPFGSRTKICRRSSTLTWVADTPLLSSHLK